MFFSLHTVTLTIAMCPKKSSSNSTGREKREVVRTRIELKKELIAKFVNGARVSDLAAQYNMEKCTISTFLKSKEAIKVIDVAKGVTIVHSKQRPQIIDEVEKLILILIREEEFDGCRISVGIICEKALHIYVDLLNETPIMSAEGDCFHLQFYCCSHDFSLSRPVEAGSKNLDTEVESIVLLGMERRPVQTRKQPKSMLANSVTS